MLNDIRPLAVSPVMLVGITGGIGSGKSYVCRQLEAAGHPVFYCDDEAKRIIRTDAAVRRELSAVVGSEVYDAGGRLVKSVLAAWLCRGRDYAARVDAIVHPRVAAAFRERAENMCSRRSENAWEHAELQLPSVGQAIDLACWYMLRPPHSFADSWSATTSVVRKRRNGLTCKCRRRKR